MGSIHVWHEALCRRVVSVLAFGVIASLGAIAPALAQEPPKVGLGFKESAGMVLFTVNSASASEFPALMQRVKEAMQKSENPVRKKQAEGWKIYRAAEPAANNNVLFVFFIDPTVPGEEYNPNVLFNEAFKEESADFVTKMKSMIVGINTINLQLAIDFSK